MLAYCGRPRSASFCDRFPYICVGYARETIAESCSIWVALATAIIHDSGSTRSTESHEISLEGSHPISQVHEVRGERETRPAASRERDLEALPGGNVAKVT